MALNITYNGNRITNIELSGDECGEFIEGLNALVGICVTLAHTYTEEKEKEEHVWKSIFHPVIKKIRG